MQCAVCSAVWDLFEQPDCSCEKASCGDWLQCERVEGGGTVTVNRDVTVAVVSVRAMARGGRSYLPLESRPDCNTNTQVTAWQIHRLHHHKYTG